MFRGRWGHGQWVGLLGLPSAGRRDPVGSSRGECPLLEGPRPAAAAPPKPTSSRAPGRAGPSVPPLPATGRAGHTLAQQGWESEPSPQKPKPRGGLRWARCLGLAANCRGSERSLGGLSGQPPSHPLAQWSCPVGCVSPLHPAQPGGGRNLNHPSARQGSGSWASSVKLVARDLGCLAVGHLGSQPALCV